MTSDLPIDIHDPELRDRVSRTYHDKKTIEIEPDEEKRLILTLVDPVVFYSLVDDDSIYEEDWKPSSPRLKEIISLLASDRLRSALMKWYSDQPSVEAMNPFAIRFTEILERETGLTLVKP